MTVTIIPLSNAYSCSFICDKNKMSLCSSDSKHISITHNSLLWSSSHAHISKSPSLTSHNISMPVKVIIICFYVIVEEMFWSFVISRKNVDGEFCLFSLWTSQTTSRRTRESSRDFISWSTQLDVSARNSLKWMTAKGTVHKVGVWDCLAGVCHENIQETYM